MYIVIHKIESAYILCVLGSSIDNIYKLYSKVSIKVELCLMKKKKKKVELCLNIYKLHNIQQKLKTHIHNISAYASTIQES